jgi:hypothetical protein
MRQKQTTTTIQYHTNKGPIISRLSSESTYDLSYVAPLPVAAVEEADALLDPAEGGGAGDSVVRIQLLPLSLEPSRRRIAGRSPNPLGAMKPLMAVSFGKEWCNGLELVERSHALQSFSIRLKF